MPDRILMKSSSVNAWSARERTAAGVVVSAFVKRDDKTVQPGVHRRPEFDDEAAVARIQDAT